MASYIVKLKSSNIVKDIDNITKKFHIPVKHIFGKALNGGFLSTISNEKLTLIKNLSGVESVEPDLNLQPFWAVENIRSVEEGSVSGRVESEVNVDVFVLDSGIDSTNTDLNVVESRIFATGSNDVSDNYGHGTQVAGCIGSRESAVGIAPGVRLHSFKITDDQGVGLSSTTILALDAVIEFKVANPSLPVVVSLNHGVYTGSTTYTALDRAVQSAVQNGIIVIVAAGNDRKDVRYYTPAHTTEAVVVGAFDKTLRYTPFSNYGKTVDILAPGSEVKTTSNDPNIRTVLANGTSISSAFVAGVAARILHDLPTATPSDVSAELIRLAQESTVRIYAAPIFTINYSTHCSV